jgi:hypothetical protein
VNDQPKGNDPRGRQAEDFLCYQMTCPGPIRNIRVNDQFNVVQNRVVRIQNAQLFCAPTNKQVVASTEEEELLDEELFLEEELEEDSK